MAITVSFNGATIRKPGSYSKTVIDLGGNFPLSPVGIVGLIGEAPRSKPGSAELIQDNVFTGAQLSALRDKFGPGSQLADAASLAFNPSNDGQIVNGAQAVYPYKTNASTQASVAIPTTYGTAKAKEYGEGGNLVALTIEASTAEVLPHVHGLHYLPSSVQSGATDFRVSACGITKLTAGVQAGYAAAAGGPNAFVTALEALTGITASGGTSVVLFAGTGATTTLAAATAAGIVTFTIGTAGTFAAVAVGDIFVLSGIATETTFNGVYLCTTASASTTMSGIKLKNLDTNLITAPSTASDAFSGANLASRTFTSIILGVDVAQASEQGASLQMDFLNAQIYGGTARTVLAAAIGSVGTIKFGNTGNSFASVVVTITGGTWIDTPLVGDMVWILSDSQLAGAALVNCGAYYVTAASATTVTLTKVDATVGTYTPVVAVTISTAGVTSNLRCFQKAQDTPANVEAIASEAEAAVVFTIDNSRDSVVETSDETGGVVVFRLGYANASATAAVMEINQTTHRLTTTITGVASVDLNINLLLYPTLQTLADYICSQTGYKAEVISPTYANMNPSVLDDVATVGILSLSTTPVAMPGRIKKNVYDVEEFFAVSTAMEATLTAVYGLPTAMVKTFLAGGTIGATSAASVVAALDEFEKVRINTVVPLFSRDSSVDIVEVKTDASSTYLIDSVHAAVKSHCILMSNTRNRSERHCVLAYRGTYVNVKLKAAALSNYRSQMVFQDIKALSTDGNVAWMQPHMLAAMVAGMRSGAVVGLPLTFKFFNISGLRHTNSILDEVPADVVIDFEPRTDYDGAIDAGLTFLENPSSGGYRMVVDNTTYTQDDNWVYNRMATLHASDVVTYDFRTRLENAIVGHRNTDFTVVSIRSLCESLLTGYKGQGLLGSTTTAPNGFSNLSIVLSGNTVAVDATVVLVEGIDFVLSTITLKRNTATA